MVVKVDKMLFNVGESVFTGQLVGWELSGSDTPQHSSSVLERLVNVLLVRLDLLQERNILIELRGVSENLGYSWCK